MWVLFRITASNFPTKLKVIGILQTVRRNVKIEMYADVVQNKESAISCAVFALKNRNSIDDTQNNAIGNTIIKIFELIWRFWLRCDGDITPNVL